MSENLTPSVERVEAVQESADLRRVKSLIARAGLVEGSIFSIVCTDKSVMAPLKFVSVSEEGIKYQVMKTPTSPREWVDAELPCLLAHVDAIVAPTRRPTTIVVIKTPFMPNPVHPILPIDPIPRKRYRDFKPR